MLRQMSAAYSEGDYCFSENGTTGGYAITTRMCALG